MLKIITFKIVFINMYVYLDPSTVDVLLFKLICYLQLSVYFPYSSSNISYSIRLEYIGSLNN